MYRSTKTYGHERGLSCAFRQWRATHSHCSLIHGYAISVAIEFEAFELDEKNWVVDFGSLDAVKHWLEYMFDHTTLVAEDDPRLDEFMHLQDTGLLKLRVLKAVGCEAFAYEIATFVQDWLVNEYDDSGRVWVSKVEVREHGANSAIYVPLSPVLPTLEQKVL